MRFSIFLQSKQHFSELNVAEMDSFISCSEMSSPCPCRKTINSAKRRCGENARGWRGRNAIEEREETKRHGEADRKWQEKELRKGRGAAR